MWLHHFRTVTETKATTWWWTFPTRWDCVWTERFSHIPVWMLHRNQTLLFVVCLWKPQHPQKSLSQYWLCVPWVCAYLLYFLCQSCGKWDKEYKEWQVNEKCVSMWRRVQARMSIFISVCTRGLSLFDLHVHASGFPPVCLLSRPLCLSRLTL